MFYTKFEDLIQIYLKRTKQHFYKYYPFLFQNSQNIVFHFLLHNNSVELLKKKGATD